MINKRRQYVLGVVMFLLSIVFFTGCVKKSVFNYVEDTFGEENHNEVSSKEETIKEKKEEEDNKEEEKKEEVQEPMLDKNKKDRENSNQKSEGEEMVVDNPNDILVWVNKERNLPKDYVPEDLVVPNVRFSFSGENEKKYLRKEAAEALEQLFIQAEEDNIDLFAVSGYRSYARQETIFNWNVQQKGLEEANKVSAKPGQSEHQTGLAMDVSCPGVGYDLVEEFEDTQEGVWLKENAHRFGFIIRYPKDKVEITRYLYEPWHIRYVGKEVATFIYEEQITLEEYFALP